MLSLSGSWGGRRHSKFDAQTQVEIEQLIWFLVLDNPLMAAHEYVVALAAVGVVVNASWVNRVFKRWGLSWKKPIYKQINKFTMDNILYYAEYVYAVGMLPWVSLKFCDESHFESRSLRCTKGLSVKGRPLLLKSSHSISESYSITVVRISSDYFFAYFMPIYASLPFFLFLPISCLFLSPLLCFVTDHVTFQPERTGCHI